MRQIFATQLTPVASKAVTDSADAQQRAGLAASQILGLALTRYVLRLPPVVAMDRETIVAWLAPTLQRYLAGSR